MRIFQVDAFADRPFTGNPAGVCVVGPGADPAWMQSVAGEMNLAETAFLVALGEARYGLRWFTPRVEVDLCGHATLASAHVLWEEYGEAAPALRFETRSGVLSAVRVDAGGVRLDFPADPPVRLDGPEGTGGRGGSDGPDGPDGSAAAIGAALGAEPVAVWRGVSDVLVEVASAAVVRGLDPDLRRVAAVPARGVVVTAPADGDVPGGADFVSRCFYPASGVDEDPVTGSAHCTLASFWCPRFGRPSLVGWQASSRGGRVGVELAGDRVLLTGRAVTVLRADLV